MATIRSATKSDLVQIVDLHLSAFKPSINSSMGIKRMTYLYEQALNSRSTILLVIVENDEVQGFICGTSDYRAFVIESKGPITISDMFRVFQKLGVLGLTREMIRSLRLHRALHGLHDIFYLSLWGMRPGLSPVLGAEIFRELIKRSSAIRSRNLIASVETENLRVNKMYSLLGFNEVKDLHSIRLLSKCMFDGE